MNQDMEAQEARRTESGYRCIYMKRVIHPGATDCLPLGCYETAGIGNREPASTFAIKCDDCKETIGETNSLGESAAGGRCADCMAVSRC